MKKASTIGTLDHYVKANRRAARLEEIREHGKQVCFRSSRTESKKLYDRKREKMAVKREKDYFV